MIILPSAPIIAQPKKDYNRRCSLYMKISLTAISFFLHTSATHLEKYLTDAAYKMRISKKFACINVKKGLQYSKIYVILKIY